MIGRRRVWKGRSTSVVGVASVAIVVAGLSIAMVFAGGLFTAADAQEIVSTGADANETVQIMKSGLIGIAIGLLVLTIFFWIHTDPSRRARAVQRKEQRRGAAAAKKARQTVEGTNPDAGSAAAVSHPDFSRPQASADDAGLSGVFSEREVS